MFLHPQLGILNYLISLIGIEPVNWLGDPQNAFITIIFVDIWHQVSFMIILFVLKLLPPFHHQLFHSLIHFILISPWLIHSFILFPEKGIPTHSSLFQDFSTSFVEYTNFIGGWGLMKENGKLQEINDKFFIFSNFNYKLK